jgi:stage V sporulation protein R
MHDYSFDDLNEWDDKICELGKKKGLSWFPISYEVVDYYTMIGHMAYNGMPSSYGHWSYGKRFERTHQMYNLGMEGLPYEMIINSNPSIAYLMRENPLYMQILIMAHCVGHSDFFKNNRMFANTRPESIIARMRNAKKRIQGYTEDPSIGIDLVEEVLDAAQSISFQTYRYGQQRTTRKELIEKYTQLIKDDEEGEYIDFDITKKPLEPDYDLLGFIAENGNFPEWKKDILEIVRDEAKYFIPQIQTKIMNEGWASMHHYDLCHELNLDAGLHLPILKSHNQVIRPHIGGLNPYHMGFTIFKDIEKRFGYEECLIARETAHDVSFIRQYLTQELCEDLGLFSYSEKRKAGITIDEIHDEDGWKIIKEDLISNIGTNGIPVIYIDETDCGQLVLRHEHDGRDLELDYADNVIRHVNALWPEGAKLFTILEEELWEI